jgi:Ni,Fe-hydrogenase III large subunit/Ni,Fe-hydrogenase III component G
MRIAGLPLHYVAIGSAFPAARARVTPAQWQEAARLVHEAGQRLVALWGADERDRGAGFSVYAAYATKDGLVVTELALPAQDPRYADLSGLFPAANRMQRALFDLLGVRAEGADDERPWLRHAAWPADTFPLRRDFDAAALRDNPQEQYPFVRVEGDGVHEIPVGPIHAGIIEPGHFRFSVVGEKVLRLEERLGYTHKGVDKRFESFAIAEGHRLAGRVSGDSTVAYAWAYAQAAEAACGVVPPARACWLRALFLERERVANHLGDLGALGNDAALGFAFAQFSRLKEDWLRLNGDIFGHRFLMDAIVPGGVARDLDAAQAERIVRQAQAIEAEVLAMHDIYDEHAGLQDRFRTCGRVTPALAVQLGLTGMAARASGQARDLRCDFPCVPYDALGVRKITAPDGDVAARVAVRFDETLESLRLIRAILDQIPPGDIHAPLPGCAEYRTGLGYVEGWRGPVLLALTSGPGETIRRCHPHDPSWSNWPVLEHAVIGNIVPDFPLINKSFNLSYSGHDL